MKRKIFAAFLSLMMVISMLPTAAFAEEVEAPAQCKHENAQWETVEEATCTESGKQVLHCHDCETDLEEKEIDPLGHDLQPTGKFVDATCTEGAGEVYACSRCDYTETKVIEGAAAVPALGHDYVETVVAPTCKDEGYTLVTCKREGCKFSEKKNVKPADENAHVKVLAGEPLKPATCDESGIGRYVCEICGKSMGYSVIQSGHKPVEVTHEEATCGKDGKITYKCSVCDKDLPEKTEILPATGKHTWVEGTKIPATCEENEKVGQVCSVCGEVGETKETPDTALGHNMVLDEEASKAATCEEKGVEVKVCANGCGRTEPKELPALGHDWQNTGNAKDPDCENPAGEEQVCANCGKTRIFAFTEPGLAKPATGHTPQVVPAVDATCSSTGLTEGSVCAVCGKELEAQKEIPVDESKHVPVQAAVLKPATCDNTGIARMECELCGKNLGYKVISDGHDFSVEVARVDATCGEDGKVTYKCSKCDKTKEEVLPATGEHDWKATYEDATCTSNAWGGDICTVCGAQKDVVEIPNTMLEHELVLDVENTKEATCEEDGVEVMKCVNCDFKTEPAVISKLGHDMVSTGFKDADCENPAREEYACSRCGKVEPVVIDGPAAVPALGHDPVETVVAPTCKDEGYTLVTCKREGCTYSKKKNVIPADENAHHAVLDAELSPASCTKPGIGRYKCEICGKSLGYQVLKAAHSIDELVEHKDSTCAEAGYDKYRCSKCDSQAEDAFKTVELPATGDHAWEVVFVDATCTKDAEAGHVCSVCGLKGEDYEPIEGSALGHDLKLDKTNEKYKAVTCEEDGLDTMKCTRSGCDYTEDQPVKATGKHSWDEGVNKDATCTKGSGALYTCTKCGATKFEEYPAGIGETAKGHTPEVIPAVAATCKTTGRTEGSKCSDCGEILVEQKETPIDENAHVEGVAATLKPATCSDPGIARYTCTLCGKNLGYKVLKAEHTIDELVEHKDPTCAEAGYDKYRCSKCDSQAEDAFKTVELPATGEHAWEDVFVDATCTKDAEAGPVCSVCGLKGEDYEPIKGTALGHDLKLDKTNEKYKAVTCEEDGLDTMKCTRSGCDYTEDQPVKATGKHTWDEGVNVPATCTEDEHLLYTCTVCKATKTEAYPDGIGQKALGHDYKKTVTPATCAKEGYTTVTCSRCDYNEITDKTPVDANNHTWNITHLKEATCTATGIDRRVCADCGKSEYVVAEKLAHTYDPEKAEMTKEPTCAEAGEVSNTCTVCGKVSVVDTIPNEGIEHKPVEIPETDTMKAGLKCEVCGKILLEPVEKCEHKNTETLEAKAATCTATGLTEGKKCADCGKILVAQEEIPMTEHTAETVAAVPATCTATGLTEGSKCSVCGKVLVAQEEVPMTEHTAETVPAVEATCTEDGLTEGSRCSVCGTVLVAQETVKALGHEEVVLEPVAPTCEGTGLTAGVKCGRCGEVLKAQEVIEAKGHTPVDFEGKEATCTEAGHTAGTKCADCGKILSGNEEIAALDHDFEFVDDTEEGVLYRCTRCGVEKVEN